MVDSSKPDEASRLDDADTLGDIWARFRAGDVVPCPFDGSRFALSVDGVAGVYRFVCTGSGHASPWFEAGPIGLHLRVPTPPSARGGATDE